MGDVILARVLLIASETGGMDASKIRPWFAVDQEMRIAGSDVEDFVRALAEEFGDHVWGWPWQRFANLDEGPGCYAFLPVFLWQILSWPFRGSFGYPRAIERLELGHIAAVIEKGEWFDPT